MLNGMGSFLKPFTKLKDKYFTEDRRNIATANLMMLLTASLAGIVILSLLIFLSPFLIKGWSATRYHMLMYVTLGLFLIFAIWYKSSAKTPDYRIVNIACMLFCVALIAHFISISVFANPDFPETLVSLSFVAAPLLFSLPLSFTALLLAVNETVFLILINNFKSAICIQHDTFSTVTAIFFSLVATWSVMRLRVLDYAARSKYQHRSRTDQLTGILNKSACTAACEKYLAAHSQNTANALFVIDIDDFKLVNDTLGHKSGDNLLEGVANVMLKIFGRNDIVGRFGGDEFCVLMKNAVSNDIISEKSQLLQSKVHEISTCLIGRDVSCSVGITVCANKRCTYSEMFSIADHALYDSKQRGKNCSTVKILR